MVDSRFFFKIADCTRVTVDTALSRSGLRGGAFVRSSHRRNIALGLSDRNYSHIMTHNERRYGRPLSLSVSLDTKRRRFRVSRYIGHRKDDRSPADRRYRCNLYVPSIIPRIISPASLASRATFLSRRELRRRTDLATIMYLDSRCISRKRRT